MKKILIIKTSSLGDIIHAFLTLEYLKNRFPKAQIDWVVEKQFAELVSAHPYVSETLHVHTTHWRKAFYQPSTIHDLLSFRRNIRENFYDVVFDLQGNTKSGLVLSQVRSLHKVGFARKSVFEWPNLLFTDHRYDPPLYGNVRDECLFLAKSYFRDQTKQEESKIRLNVSKEQLEKIQRILNQPAIQNGPKILVCPGSAWPNKRVTSETLTSFLTLLQNHLQCSFLFLWGSQQEQQFAQELQGLLTNARF